MRQTDPIAEGARLLTICNACRYCEGYCAVFPAMERRRNFGEADLHYLANLCHNCAECYDACQYAPPHEFAVDLPKVLGEVRWHSYQKCAWPRVFGHTGKVIGTTLLLGLAAGFWFAGRSQPADFYSVIPHGAMVKIFGGIAVVVWGVLVAGLVRFWREGPLTLVAARNFDTAARDVLTLRHASSGARRWFHHFTFYGFLLCFASTSVAAFYHYALGRRAPYALLSLPVVLGILGGIGLLIGPVGLFRLGRRYATDLSFLVLLFATSLTGLLLLALRQSRGMGPLLVIHLGIVLALFVSLPYGKFVHGIYRSAALLRNAMEEHGGRESQRAGQR